MNQASLESLVVPVLPNTSKGWAAAVAVPRVTASRIATVTWSATSTGMTRVPLAGPGDWPRTPPPYAALARTSLKKRGAIRTPWLASVP